MSNRIYSEADGQAFEKAEQEAATRGYVLDKHNAELVVEYFDRHPDAAITAAFVRQVMDAMHRENLLHWKSEAQVSFESAAQGLSAQQLATLDSGLAQYTLITEGEEGLQNKVAVLGYLKGRPISHDEIYRGAQYLMGKGVQLHWKPRPSQSEPSRGHNANRPPTAEDMVWISKNEANQSYTGRPNHAQDPRFNGTLEREKRREQERRAGVADTTTESARAMEAYWQSEIDKLISSGVTHSDRGRIAQVAQQTPGSARQRISAVKAEADANRRARELSRA